MNFETGVEKSDSITITTDQTKNVEHRGITIGTEQKSLSEMDYRVIE